ncbi:MAG: DUF5694 domain-containing protein [Bacteriovoracaceae bacterium]|jgi:hypothetical protein|nr:hypothetical protein [Halobacteriovoraceae bacterium]MDP7320474.1 DUF5694 domain-containing protein [Bacteriovoracaceae bacterium]|tara:strand:- start:204 stop:881 length:678 start_codon:yes stop_codon:yes gene_type:complete
MTKDKRPDIYLLGLPHFNSANDKVNSCSLFQDISSKRRQSEIQELVDKLVTINFQSICVEMLDQKKLEHEYKLYLQTGYLPNTNEIYEIAFKLAKAKQLKNIYACDHKLPMGKFSIPEPKLLSSWEKNFQEQLKKTYAKSLLNTIQLLNTTDHSFIYKSIFLKGAQEEEKAIMKWYQRNLKILKNIMSYSTDSPTLVMIGAGHLYILTHLAHSLDLNIKQITLLD